MRIAGLGYQTPSIIKTVDVLDVQVTTDATPKVIYSIPIPTDKALGVRANFFVFDMAFQFGAYGVERAMALFDEASIVVPGSDLSAVNNFVAPFPSLTFVKNNATGMIDVTITGKTGLTLHWHIELEQLITT